MRASGAQSCRGRTVNPIRGVGCDVHNEAVAKAPKPSLPATIRPLSLDEIRSKVHTLRGEAVMLDEDLAVLYGVTTGRLMEQVRRNAARFPSDFMFELSDDEIDNLKSQNAISSYGHGGRRKRPHVFTEQGVAMLSGVLRSEQAVAVNVEIMRAFVALRRMTATHSDLARRLEDLEGEMRAKLGEHDQALVQLTEILRALTTPAQAPRRRIGFAPPEDA